jgi:hypothetical protein
MSGERSFGEKMRRGQLTQQKRSTNAKYLVKNAKPVPTAGVERKFTGVVRRLSTNLIWW